MRAQSAAAVAESDGAGVETGAGEQPARRAAATTRMDGTAISPNSGHSIIVADARRTILRERRP